MAESIWSPKPPTLSIETYNLLVQNDPKEPRRQTVTDIIENSDKFPIEFPVHTGRCKTLKNYTSESILERNINSVHPVIHEHALELYCKLLLYKREHGSSKEKTIYKNMTLNQLIDRLLTKRAVTFMGKQDIYLLINGVKGSEGWGTIGTDHEQPPLVLHDYLSYDEIKLSAFLSVSSYTYFVNIGDRHNMARYATDRKGIADEGVIVGMIGTRLERPNVMEYEEIVIDDKQNVLTNGYGTTVNNSIHKLFSDFYEEPCRDYTESVDYRRSLPSNSSRYTDLKVKNSMFDNDLYYKRLAISIDTLLMEANYRAKLRETTAYVHVVGIGLGVWKISSHQGKEFMNAFAKRIT